MTQREILLLIQAADTSAKDELADNSILAFLRFSKSYFSWKSIKAIMHFPIVCELGYHHLYQQLLNTDNNDLQNIINHELINENKLNSYLAKHVWKDYLIGVLKSEEKKSTKRSTEE